MRVVGATSRTLGRLATPPSPTPLPPAEEGSWTRREHPPFHRAARWHDCVDPGRRHVAAVRAVGCRAGQPGRHAAWAHRPARNTPANLSRRFWGLDQPVPVRLLAVLPRTGPGRPGRRRHQRPVRHVAGMASALPYTITLTAFAIGLAVVLRHPPRLPGSAAARIPVRHRPGRGQRGGDRHPVLRDRHRAADHLLRLAGLAARAVRRRRTGRAGAAGSGAVGRLGGLHRPPDPHVHAGSDGRALYPHRDSHTACRAARWYSNTH